MSLTPDEKILVFGATGMLGRALLAEARARGLFVVGAARSGADVVCDLSDPSACAAAIYDASPNLVVNAAALIDFAECEDNPHVAGKINARAPGILADAAARVGARFVQISTDHYYFQGDARPHAEGEPVTLANVYARTKFAGEIAALAEETALVLRTNIVGFGGLRGRRTFAEWAFDVVEGDQPAGLFADYFTSSIGVGAFSGLVLDIAAAGATGIVNLASRTVASKLEFVVALARARGRSLSNARATSVKSLPVPRACSCGLDVSKAEAILGRKMPTLDAVIGELVREWEHHHVDIR